MMASHCFVEPRVCAECDAFDIEFDQRECPYCDGPTRALSDYQEDLWYAQEQDKMSEPLVPAHSRWNALSGDVG